MRVKDPASIKRARKRADYTQRQLAYLTGCSHTTIHLLETGKLSTLSFDLACAIAKRLGCDPEDLFVERLSTVVPAVVSGSATDPREAVPA